MVRAGVWSDPYKRRWLGWAALAASFILVSFHRVSTTVIAGDLMRAFEATGAELGLLHASFYYIYAVLQVPAGALVDRAGVRKVASLGTIVMSFGAVGFGLSGSYLGGFLSRGLIGLGGSVLYLAVLRYCANWYRADEYATMVGLTIAGSGLGALLASTPFAVAVEGYGWRPSIVGLGGIGLFVAVSIYLAAHHTPERAGLRSIAGVPSAPTVSFSSLVSDTKRVLSDRGMWVLGILLFVTVGASFTVFGLWAIPYMVQSYGISVEHASLYVLIANLGFLTGPPTIGWLSDRIEQRAGFVLVASAVFITVYGTIVTLGTPPLLLVGLLFFLSKFMGGGFSLVYTLAKERHPTEMSGVAVGTVNSMGWLGAAIYPTAMGAILDFYWTGETVAGARQYTLFGYRIAFALVAVSGVIVLLGAIWVYLEEKRDRS